MFLVRQIIHFIVIFLVNCERQIYEFLDLSDELQASFDSFALVSRQEQGSNWCKVNRFIHEKVTQNSFELIINTNLTIIRNSNTYFITYRMLLK